MRRKEEYPLDNFKNHVLTIIHEHESVKRYQFKQPDTGCYGFNLTCADNLMIMTGDCYTMVIEPGYGRCGLAFLRGSIKSLDYFLGKSPFREQMSEYKHEYALEDMKEYIKDYYEDGYEDKWLDFKGRLNGEDGPYGEASYYEACSYTDIDEPPRARRMTSTTKMQIAGLMAFVEAYEKVKQGINFIVTKIEISKEEHGATRN